MDVDPHAVIYYKSVFIYGLSVSVTLSLTWVVDTVSFILKQIFMRN